MVAGAAALRCSWPFSHGLYYLGQEGQRRRCFCTTIVLLPLSMEHHESTVVVEVMEVLSNSHCGTLLIAVEPILIVSGPAFGLKHK